MHRPGWENATLARAMQVSPPRPYAAGDDHPINPPCKHPPGPTSGRDRHCEKLLDDLRELPCTRPDPQMSIVEDVEF